MVRRPLPARTGGRRRAAAAGGAPVAAAAPAAGWRIRRPRRRRRAARSAARAVAVPDRSERLLLSGLLVGGEALAGRAVAIDAPVGKGHVVMFANRPYWRWQTQGNFFLGFNAILNWNDLDAGRAPTRPAATQQQ